MRHPAAGRRRLDQALPGLLMARILRALRRAFRVRYSTEAGRRAAARLAPWISRLENLGSASLLAIGTLVVAARSAAPARSRRWERAAVTEVGAGGQRPEADAQRHPLNPPCGGRER